eukprot:6050441-Pleurochrysis_carterae.AAC.1
MTPFPRASPWPSSRGTTGFPDTTPASRIHSTTTARSSLASSTLSPRGKCTATTSTPSSPKADRPPTSTR